MKGKYRHFWKRSEDGNYREERALLRWVAGTSVVFAAVILFFKQDNVFRWIDSGITVHRQEKQIEQYMREIENMDRFLRTVKGNTDSLERFAREKFLFCEPGEDVYIYEDRDKEKGYDGVPFL